MGDLVDNLEKFEHWEDIAKYDLETAEAMYHAGRYLYVCSCVNKR
jgi:hypothetical protein